MLHSKVSEPRSKPRPEPLESEIQAELIERLNLISGVIVWRSNVGRRRYIRFGKPGQGDLSGLIGLSGRRLEVEVKRKGEVQSDDQIKFEAMILEHGGLYLVCCGNAEVDLTCERVQRAAWVETLR